MSASTEASAAAPSSQLRGAGDVLRLAAEPQAIVTAREFVRAAAMACKLDSTECYKFVYAVNEAVTNAVKHGTPDAQGMITLTVEHDSRVLTIAVSDCGSFDARAGRNPGDIQSGRGLGLMIGLTDALRLQSDDSGTTVFLSKQLQEPKTESVPSP